MLTPAQFQHEIGVRIGRGELAGACAAAANCRAAWPNDPTGWLLGSITALMRDDREGALALADEWLRAHPRDVQCLIQKAECLLALGDRSAALEAAAAASDYAPEILPVLDAIGEFWAHAGEHRRALETYDRALAAAPDNATLLIKRAVVHRFLGNFDLAADDYRAVLLIAPGTPKALKGLAELHRQSADQNSVAAMESALAAAPTDSVDAAILHFGLAKSYDDLGDHSASWTHLQAGNRLERRRLQYDPATDQAVIQQMIDAFPSIEATCADTTGERPIFIVGVPRTGTTLVDRILGNHSAVQSAGELTALPATVDILVERAAGAAVGLDYATILHDLDGPQIAAEYLAQTRAVRGDRPRFTDKQLTNFLYCALIFRAFPNAAVVHLTRHPLAACHAIYRTRFNGSYPFAYDLQEIADFYIGYRRLMRHWHRVLPGRILDIAYEDVVRELEPTTRRLLDYVGLPFEDRCLRFHLNPAPVITTSSVQVRQPLYDTSLDAWQDHAAALMPVRERLEAAGIRLD